MIILGHIAESQILTKGRDLNSSKRCKDIRVQSQAHSEPLTFHRSLGGDILVSRECPAGTLRICCRRLCSLRENAVLLLVTYILVCPIYGQLLLSAALSCPPPRVFS